MDDYTVGVVTNVGLLSLLALSAYVVLLSGELSFGQQGFFAVGAYAGSVATAMFGWQLAPAALIAVMTGASCAALVGILTLRLRGMYFAIATLAIAEMLRIGFELLRWQVDVEGTAVGPDGSQGFRGIRWAYEADIGPVHYLVLVWLVLCGVILVIALIERSRFGAVVRAIGEDTDLAVAVGLRVDTVKLAVITFSGGLAALSGVLFAHHNTYIEPQNFNVMLGVHALAYPLIGGLGTAFGPLLGVALDLGVLEGSQFFSGYRMMIFGGLVAILLWFRPRGILNETAVCRILGK